MHQIFTIAKAQLLGVGQVEADAGWRLATHTHPYWEFVYFLHGCGSVNLPHATLRPRYFHLLIFYPGLPHAETADPLDPEETIHFTVDVPGVPPPEMPLLLPDPQGEFRWLCEQLLHEQLQYGKVTPLANTYTQAFLQLVERAVQSGTAHASAPIDLVIQYLTTNYASQVTMETLAAITHITSMHLTHTFTARVGISPMRYLKQLRIEAAKQLLATTTATVNDIANRVGYLDPLYFRRVFKAECGITPSEFRSTTFRVIF